VISLPRRIPAIHLCERPCHGSFFDLRELCAPPNRPSFHSLSIRGYKPPLFRRIPPETAISLHWFLMRSFSLPFSETGGFLQPISEWTLRKRFLYSSFSLNLAYNFEFRSVSFQDVASAPTFPYGRTSSLSSKNAIDPR